MADALDWVDDIILPLGIWLGNAWDDAVVRQLQDRSAANVQTLDRMPVLPWTWFPRELPVLGLGAPDQWPRVWFWGYPKGQESDAFRDVVLALGRGRQRLSPISRATVSRITEPLFLAVLTTPG